MTSNLPLQGITVVSLEQAVAAPFATRHLADLGARVIKVERPDGGDIARGYDEAVHGNSSYFVWLNRSKESLTLDVKSPEGRAVLGELLDRADVLVQNLGPGAAGRLGSMRRALYAYSGVLFNPWQRPIGRRTQGALELMGIRVYRADAPEQVGEVVGAGLDSAFLAGEQVAVLLGQTPDRPEEVGARLMTSLESATRRPDRRAFVAELLAGAPDALVVSGLGSASYNVYAAGDRDENFYLWGAMGAAVPVGLGLALAQPDRSVVVVTGDGEQLMGLGSLATVGVRRPQNLTVVVLDNGHFGETGMQQSWGTDLVAVARGCGIEDAACGWRTDAL